VRQYFNYLVRDNGGAGVTLKPAKARKKEAQMTCRMVRGPGDGKKSAQRNFSLLWGRIRRPSAQATAATQGACGD
jgi:hypothetical protein